MLSTIRLQGASSGNKEGARLALVPVAGHGKGSVGSGVAGMEGGGQSGGAPSAESQRARVQMLEEALRQASAAFAEGADEASRGRAGLAFVSLVQMAAQQGIGGGQGSGTVPAAAAAVSEVQSAAEAVAACIVSESAATGSGGCPATTHALLACLLRWACGALAPPRSSLGVVASGSAFRAGARGGRWIPLPAHALLLDVRPMDCAALVAAAVSDSLRAELEGSSKERSLSSRRALSVVASWTDSFASVCGTLRKGLALVPPGAVGTGRHPYVVSGQSPDLLKSSAAGGAGREGRAVGAAVAGLGVPAPPATRAAVAAANRAGAGGSSVPLGLPRPPALQSSSASQGPVEALRQLAVLASGVAPDACVVLCDAIARVAGGAGLLGESQDGGQQGTTHGSVDPEDHSTDGLPESRGGAGGLDDGLMVAQAQALRALVLGRLWSARAWGGSACGVRGFVGIAGGEGGWVPAGGHGFQGGEFAGAESVSGIDGAGDGQGVVDPSSGAVVPWENAPSGAVAPPRAAAPSPAQPPSSSSAGKARPGGIPAGGFDTGGLVARCWLEWARVLAPMHGSTGEQQGAGAGSGGSSYPTAENPPSLAATLGQDPGTSDAFPGNTSSTRGHDDPQPALDARPSLQRRLAWSHPATARSATAALVASLLQAAASSSSSSGSGGSHPPVDPAVVVRLEEGPSLRPGEEVPGSGMLTAVGSGPALWTHAGAGPASKAVAWLGAAFTEAVACADAAGESDLSVALCTALRCRLQVEGRALLTTAEAESALERAIRAGGATAGPAPRRGVALARGQLGQTVGPAAASAAESLTKVQWDAVQSLQRRIAKLRDSEKLLALQPHGQEQGQGQGHGHGTKRGSASSSSASSLQDALRMRRRFGATLEQMPVYYAVGFVGCGPWDGGLDPAWGLGDEDQDQDQSGDGDGGGDGGLTSWRKSGSGSGFSSASPAWRVFRLEEGQSGHHLVAQLAAAHPGAVVLGPDTAVTVVKGEQEGRGSSEGSVSGGQEDAWAGQVAFLGAGALADSDGVVLARHTSGDGGPVAVPMRRGGGSASGTGAAHIYVYPAFDVDRTGASQSAASATCFRVMVPRGQTATVPWLQPGGGGSGGQGSVGDGEGAASESIREHPIEGSVPVFARKFHKRDDADAVVANHGSSPVVCLELELDGGPSAGNTWRGSGIAGFGACPAPTDEQIALAAVGSTGGSDAFAAGPGSG